MSWGWFRWVGCGRIRLRGRASYPPMARHTGPQGTCSWAWQELMFHSDPFRWMGWNWKTEDLGLKEMLVSMTLKWDILDILLGISNRGRWWQKNLGIPKWKQWLPFPTRARTQQVRSQTWFCCADIIAFCFEFWKLHKFGKIISSCHSALLTADHKKYRLILRGFLNRILWQRQVEYHNG